MLLGCGYLAKAPLFIFGIVTLVVCGWLYRPVALAERARGLATVAELPTSNLDDFWKLDATRRADVLQRFADCGVRAVVSQVPSGSVTGWRRLGETPFLIYLFPTRVETKS